MTIHGLHQISPRGKERYRDLRYLEFAGKISGGTGQYGGRSMSKGAMDGQGRCVGLPVEDRQVEQYGEGPLQMA